MAQPQEKMARTPMGVAWYFLPKSECTKNETKTEKERRFWIHELVLLNVTVSGLIGQE